MINSEMNIRQGYYNKYKSMQKYIKWRRSFYNGNKWKSIRKEIFSIRGKHCSKCRSLDNIQIDHIYPVSYYPELRYEISNLQPLCIECNKTKSNINNDRFITKQWNDKPPCLNSCVSFYNEHFLENKEKVHVKKKKKKKTRAKDSSLLWKQTNKLYKDVCKVKG